MVQFYGTLRNGIFYIFSLSRERLNKVVTFIFRFKISYVVNNMVMSPFKTNRFNRGCGLSCLISLAIGH